MITEQSMTHNPRMEGSLTAMPTPEPGPTENPDSDADGDILRISREAYSKSTQYFETNQRHKWETSIRLFRGLHAPGSKYYTDAYSHRSRLFRPKTRASVRRHEAAAAAAYFSSSDMLSVEANNPSLPETHLAASIAHAVVNTRLQNTIPWFATLMGAYQNTMTQGAVASKAHWVFEESTAQSTETITDEFTGATTTTPIIERTTVTDKPAIDLIPLENIRFDPDCDWRDPANTSPYIIELIPMYAGDVLAKKHWRAMTLTEVLTHGVLDKYQQSTRRARRGDTPRDSTIEGSELSLVWVREYHVKIQNVVYVWHTLGDSLVLSDPTPRTDIYLHGNPYRIGYSWIEAFNPLPDSMVYAGRDLQAKANDVDNQRFDNVRLVLNKRYFIRHGAQINERQLYRSVPGGSVRMQDVHNDIKTDETRDVTGSAYAEQQVVNTDFDELNGSFSQGAMQQSLQKRASVGGMEMMNASADAVTEYQLKTFAETWVEPVLTQLARLTLAYESDDEVLRQAGADQRWADIPQQVLDSPVTMRVNVGMGATDPMTRVNKFMAGMNAVSQIPNVAQRIKEDEVIAEVFGRLGYKDGSRFFNTEEEARAAQEAQQHPQVMAEQIKAQNAEQDRQYRAWELEQRLQTQRDIAMLEMSTKQGISMEQLYRRLEDAQQARVDKAKVELSKQAMSDRTKQREQQTRRQEMELKRLMGTGI